MSQTTNNLEEIFDKIRDAIAKYENRPLKARINRAGRYDLWSEKSVVINGKKRKDVYFGSAIIQSNYVGFYFMPAYTEQEASTMFSQNLLKKLKGKSCFHIKELDDKLLEDIKQALNNGYKAYQKRNWV